MIVDLPEYKARQAAAAASAEDLDLENDCNGVSNDQNLIDLSKSAPPDTGKWTCILEGDSFPNIVGAAYTGLSLAAEGTAFKAMKPKPANVFKGHVSKSLYNPYQQPAQLETIQLSRTASKKKKKAKKNKRGVSPPKDTTSSEEKTLLCTTAEGVGAAPGVRDGDIEDAHDASDEDSGRPCPRSESVVPPDQACNDGDHDVGDGVGDGNQANVENPN